MTLLILGLWRKYREFTNAWRFNDARRIGTYVTTAAIALLFMTLVSTNTRTALLFSNETALSVLAGNFTAFTALVASFTLSRALNDLFLAQDFELVASSPVSLSQVLGGRIGEITVQNLPLALVFVFPSLIALNPHAASKSFMLLGLMFVILQVAVVTAISCMALLLLTFVVPARLLKQVIYVAWTVGFLALYIWTNVQLQSSEGINISDAYVKVGQTGLASVTAWASEGLKQAFYGFKFAAFGYFARLAATSLVTISISTQVLGRSIYVGRSALGQTSLTTIARRESRLLALVHPDYRAIAEKEYLTFSRDVRELTGILYALTLAALFAWRMDTLGANLSVAVLPTAFYAGNLQIRTSLPAFGREGKQWLLLQAAPLKARSLLMAKFIPWAFFSGLSSLALGSFLALLAGLPPADTFLCGIMGLLIGVSCVAASLYLGVKYADFTAERPEEYVLSTGRWATLALTLVFAGVSFVGIMPAQHLRSWLGYISSTVLMCALAGVTLYYARRGAETILRTRLNDE